MTKAAKKAQTTKAPPKTKEVATLRQAVNLVKLVIEDDSTNLCLFFTPNTKQKGTADKPNAAYTRYNAYMHADTYAEFKALGGTNADLKYDLAHNLMFVGTYSRKPAEIVAKETCKGGGLYPRK